MAPGARRLGVFDLSDAQYVTPGQKLYRLVLKLVSVRFYRRLKLAPGLRLNVSRRGPSLSIGGHAVTETMGVDVHTDELTGNGCESVHGFRRIECMTSDHRLAGSSPAGC